MRAVAVALAGGDLLRDRRCASADAISWRWPASARWRCSTWSGHGGFGHPGRHRGRLPGPALRPDLAELRWTVQRRNPIDNASGAHGTHHAGGRGDDRPDRARAGGGDVASAVAAIAIRRKALGRVMIPAAAGIQPIRDPGRAELWRRGDLPSVSVLGTMVRAADRLGMLLELRFPRRLPIRWPLTARASALLCCSPACKVCTVPCASDAFTPNEVAASQWLYAHAPRGSLIVLPVDNFPALEAADYNDFDTAGDALRPATGRGMVERGGHPGRSSSGSRVSATRPATSSSAAAWLPAPTTLVDRKATTSSYARSRRRSADRSCIGTLTRRSTA